MKYKTAILASGEGTTAEAFIRDEVAADGLAKVVLVIASRAEAGILQRMQNLNQELGLEIETMVINGQTHPAVEAETVEPGCQTVAEQAAILEALLSTDIELVLLLGYMKRVGPEVIQFYGWRSDYESPYQARLLNTHPGLLPATQGTYGIHAQALVLEQRLAEAGQTLHAVSAEYDDGPTIAENKVGVEADDTPESLFARVQAAEKAHLAADIDAFIKARQQYILEA